MYQWNPFTRKLDKVSAGSNEVSGPGSSTDKAVARWNGTGGNTLQNSVVIIGDTGAVTGVLTLNGLTITTTTGTLTITNGKTLSVSNTLTFTGTDSSSVNFGTGGTVAYFSTAVVTADGSLAVNTGTLANKGTLLTLTLPTTAAVGTLIRVTGMNAGLWRIAQNANQKIHFGLLTTTTGVGGSITSTATYDSIDLVCSVANLEWVATSSIGNLTVV